MKTLPRVINRPLIHQQTGAVLFVSLMFLIVLTMLGISALDSTKLETRMAANTKEYNQAFENAEAAIATAAVDCNEQIKKKTGACNDLVTEKSNRFTDFQELQDLATGTARYRVMLSGSSTHPRYGSAGAQFFLIESEGTSIKKDSETSSNNEATTVKLHAGIFTEIAVDKTKTIDN